MRFRFVWIGKTKDKNWRALQEDYLARLSHFARVEISEIKDSQPHDTKETEGKRILEILPENVFTVLLDVAGKQIASHELAGENENWQNRSLKEIVFIIGGQDGVSEAITARENFKLSLSKMTFTHETARVILLEQIYRAFTIIHRFPYQK
ncbi:MAG TPA: 23S rRNA (pseudouridine(1915)-N(3))-methyltransferase RlmH [Pyrinomonadaceae bacterium]|nr:23S rRNA (pseudouridine(1915)-N(3))-methyltransferase RlmH [Pyrinomonadaceae bacterium]